MEELIIMKQKNIFKTLEDMESSKTDYSKLIYRSGENKYFDFNRFVPLFSFCLKLINGNIGISVAKLNMKEFRDEIDRLKGKKAKKEPYKTNKKEVLKNAEALYDGLKKIMDAFERRVFECGGCPVIDVDYDSGTYGLTTKILQIFKKLFKYDNPYELWNALMHADKEKHDELLSNLKIKETVLNKQINIKIGVECRKLENLANIVGDILDSIRESKDVHFLEITDLESEESAAQGRNQPGWGLKILTPNQMLSRLPISLAELKAGNNSQKLKSEIRQLLYSLYRSKKLTKNIYKNLIDII